jgi:hypothetical protein
VPSREPTGSIGMATTIGVTVIAGSVHQAAGHIRYRTDTAADRQSAGTMSKPRVTFAPKRIAEGEWQIEAHYPGAEIRYITGLNSRDEVYEWLNGNRKLVWLRSQGYAK